jgi:hypothetical protein
MKNRLHCPRGTVLGRAAALILSAVLLLAALCACGGDLDGTWKSLSDDDTRIRFSGENVRITYDKYRIEGTYELSEDNVITFHLTDENGTKYKIVGILTLDKKNKQIILTNSKGEAEIFEK